MQQGGTASGTGIVMSDDGYVITNSHVIESAQQIFVLLSDENTYAATLVGGRRGHGSGGIEGGGHRPHPGGVRQFDALRVGDVVVAIGDPLGTELRGTMTDGIVSAINRDLNLSGRQMTLIQTNAALNSGNSGGPLINCYGQVHRHQYHEDELLFEHLGHGGGLGLCHSHHGGEAILDELIQQGYVSGRPAIGIEGETLDISTQWFFHMPSGVIITAVEETSDAAAKGLQPDDVIVGLNDSAIDSLEDLVAAKNDLSAGDQVTAHHLPRRPLLRGHRDADGSDQRRALLNVRTRHARPYKVHRNVPPHPVGAAIGRPLACDGRAMRAPTRCTAMFHRIRRGGYQPPAGL